jgi:ubiquitin-protein ligase
MQLIYNYAPGFQPIGNELNRWQGAIEVQTSQGSIPVPIEILIPLKFPQYPPRVLVKAKEINHPNIQKDGNVLLRITHEWKPDIHVYQVIDALKGLFKKVPPRFGKGADKPKAKVQSRDTFKTKKQQKVEDLNKDITDLQNKIQAKDEELRRLRTDAVKGKDEGVTHFEDLDILLPKDKARSEKLLLRAQSVALADLLSTLDEKFKDGDITAVDFTKLYRRYSKELYLTQKKLEQK